MRYPEDRVLIGVINRKRDLTYALDEHWYRIPQERMPRGVNVECVAFFLSGSATKSDSGIYYYAEKHGLELLRRKDLLPREKQHKHAENNYYKVALGEIEAKTPPILNPTRRPISFIYTTWDRFVKSETIHELYSEDDYFVDRIYHALRDRGLRPDRLWSVEGREHGIPAQIRILCENGSVVASPDPDNGTVYMDKSLDDDAILTAIRADIARQGGPVTINIPLEGD